MNEAISRPKDAAAGADEDGRAEVAIMWFRRDLRVDDNPALAAALKYAKHVVSLLEAETRKKALFALLRPAPALARPRPPPRARAPR